MALSGESSMRARAVSALRKSTSGSAPTACRRVASRVPHRSAMLTTGNPFNRTTSSTGSVAVGDLDARDMGHRLQLPADLVNVTMSRLRQELRKVGSPAAVRAVEALLVRPAARRSRALAPRAGAQPRGRCYGPVPASCGRDPSGSFWHGLRPASSFVHVLLAHVV
jgi:hypothetical protein